VISVISKKDRKKSKSIEWMRIGLRLRD